MNNSNDILSATEPVQAYMNKFKRRVRDERRVGDVYDFMLFSDSFYFLQENFNVWIEEKHKIIDVPFPPQLTIMN